jgi:hypothetical protein
VAKVLKTQVRVPLGLSVHLWARFKLNPDLSPAFKPNQVHNLQPNLQPKAKASPIPLMERADEDSASTQAKGIRPG